MKLITRLSVIFWAFLALSCPLAGAQHTTIVNLASLPEWQVRESRNVSLNDVRQWGVEPLVDREYGVTKVEIRTYGKASQTLQAMVETTPDPSSAYGLLTFYQNESMRPGAGMKLSVIGPGQALIARGTFFVRVMRPAKMPEENFRSALVAIAGAAPSSDSMALLPPSLPVQGIISGTHKYVLGPVAMQRAVPSIPPDLVGFQMGAELQTANYRTNSKPVSLVFISYPTNSIARARFAEFQKRLGLNQKNGSGSVFGKLESSYVLLVENAQSKEAAQRLMSKLNIEEQVSWDQRPPGVPVTVQMFKLIVGNIILVVLLVGMAVLTGFLLFASRRLAARWFPHSDWARGYEDSIIRLNLK
ncbi:MAG: hypothetical protein EPN47_15680 [Acidobacteria bacterium]|nr:MAG: hypothetical protein EPN47_15680 [Acidobacteriota bacterium]